MKLSLIFGLISIVYCSKFHTDFKFAPKGICKALEAKEYNIDDVFPKLSECYSGSSLFFSVSHNVCKDNCKKLTIEASQHIVKHCNIPKPNKDNILPTNHYLSYYVWSNEKAVDLICSKKPGTEALCVNQIINAKTIIDNSKAASLPQLWTISKTDKDKVCQKCVLDMVTFFKDKPYEIPMVYYASVLEPDEFLQDVTAICF